GPFHVSAEIGFEWSPSTPLARTPVDPRFRPRHIGGSRLQFFCAIKFAQIAVERSERHMTGLSSNFEKEAISEAKRWSRPERLECSCHDIALLEDQIVVVQELLDRRANLCGITPVDSGQHPCRL